MPRNVATAAQRKRRKRLQRLRRRRNTRQFNKQRNNGAVSGYATSAPTITEGTTAAIKYFHASTQPWNSPPVGLPIEPALRSRKVKLWVKGVVSCGDDGTGFIGSTLSWCNDLPNVFFTDSTYLGSTFSTIPGGGVIAENCNSPFSSVQLNSGSLQVEARAVAAGMRIRYIGTELNRGGRILAFEHPDHSDMAGMSATDLLSFPNTHFEAVDRQWHSAHWQHIWPGEETYTNTCEPTPNPNEPVQPNMCYGIMISAKGISGLVFEFECYTLVEYIGSLTSTDATPSVTHAQKTNILKQKLSQMTVKQKMYLGRSPVDKIESVGLNLLNKEDPTVAKYAKKAMPILNTLGTSAFALAA